MLVEQRIRVLDDQLQTTIETAETIKYASNALLATAISFSNEIGNVCSRLPGVDVKEVMRGVHLDRRISPQLEDGSRVSPGLTTYLEAGCGFGGSCFPKDLKALIAHGKSLGEPMDLLQSVVRINETQPSRVLELARSSADGSLAGKSIAVLGAAFKPGTDDVRESPAIPLIEQATSESARVTVYDPVAAINARAVLPPSDHLRFAESLEEAIDDADIVILMTAWSEFDQLGGALKQARSTALVVDGRRALDPEAFAHYKGIGIGA